MLSQTNLFPWETDMYESKLKNNNIINNNKNNNNNVKKIIIITIK